MSSSNLQKQFNILFKNFAKIAVQKLHDVSIFDRFDDKDKNFKDCNCFNKRRRGAMEIDKQKRHYILLHLLIKLI